MGAVEGAEKQHGIGTKVEEVAMAVGILSSLISLSSSSSSPLLYFLLFRLRCCAIS